MPIFFKDKLVCFREYAFIKLKTSSETYIFLSNESKAHQRKNDRVTNYCKCLLLTSLKKEVEEWDHHMAPPSVGNLFLILVQDGQVYHHI